MAQGGTVNGFSLLAMNRPASEIRPFGPFIGSEDNVSQPSGVAKIRAKFLYTTRTGATEVKQSLEQSVEKRVSEVVPVSNVTVNTGSEDFMMEVAMDIDKKPLTDTDESQIQRAVGRALIAGGVQNANADGYEYMPVMR